MRQPTELMYSILTDETAQKIIDYVSPVYGNSYVGLWMFQAIGTLLGEVYEICSDLRYETTPATSTLLLDYWEKEYGLNKDTSLTIDQRRSRIIQKTLTRGPCNPAVLSAALSNALGGVQVDIEENTAKNTFRVNVRKVVEDLSPAIAILERRKPAHLIYEIRVGETSKITSEINVGAAMTFSEKISMEVTQ